MTSQQRHRSDNDDSDWSLPNTVDSLAVDIGQLAFAQRADAAKVLGPGIRILTEKLSGNELIVFYGASAWLSTYFYAPVTNGEITFSTCHHEFLWRAAMSTNDLKIASAIVTAATPWMCTCIARCSTRFNPQAFSHISKPIMLQCLKRKFTQHDDLKEKLIACGDSKIIFASPYDMNFGVGLALNDPNINDVSVHYGANNLGRLLVETREWLKNGAHA